MGKLCVQSYLPRKDLPEREAYGYAYIPLKSDAIPQRQKEISLQGERLEAHERVTADWKKHFFYKETPQRNTFGLG